MKSEGHPEYFETTVNCSGCGSTFNTGSTIPEIRISVCSECHPFFTGKQRLVDSEGRVDRFKKKYANFDRSALKEKKKK